MSDQPALPKPEPRAAGREEAPDPVLSGLQYYVVGGAVRDDLLGRPAGDRDWVVVGASPEDMVRRGFLPVGDDFPVFLHPRTREEYALARTERKSGRGYHGFVFHTGPDVSLEDDLRRRDLTINAMARSADGQLIDPLDGRADLDGRILRHVGDAFVEDPVRLLRLARFAARFADFAIAPQTQALCHRLVSRGEVDALVPERVWQELAKGLLTDHPQRMLQVLAECGALARVAPALVWNDTVRAGLVCAAQQGLSLAQRYALLCRASPPALQKQLRAPGACRDLARLLPGVLERLTRADAPETWLDLIEFCDGLRRPSRCLALVEAATCVRADVRPAVWTRRLQAVRALDAGAIARAAGSPQAIREALRQARLDCLRALPA